MTAPEWALEAWRLACAAYEDAAEEHPEMPLRDMVIAGDNAAVSVIRTAMEAYAAEKVTEAKEALADIRNKPYAPWPDPDPDDTVGAMIDNQAWVMLSHIASFIGHRDGQPDLMEEWQNDWAENYPALLKDWFSPHRAAAKYIADRLTVRPQTPPSPSPDQRAGG